MKVTVVKIGGNIVDNPAALELFLKNFQRLEGPKVLIHGGGAIASQLSKKLGLEVKMHNGRRITDLETLKLVTMVYAGLINKQIVAALQSLGCNALGLCGADGDTVPAKMRQSADIDWGYVGDVNPDEVNGDFICNLLARGITPVFCAITHNRNGSLLNTNADTMASSIARAIAKECEVRLVFCFEKQGVLSDPNNDDSVIPLITKNMYEKLKGEGAIKDGMLPKLDNAFKAIDDGVSEVVINPADNLLINKETILK